MPAFSAIRRAVLLLAGLSLASAVAAQGEHSRRAAVEIQVLLGDIARLSSPGISDAHQTGLHDRIAGGLGVLEILLRLADSEVGRPLTDHAATLRSLREHWDAQDMNVLRQQLDGLSAVYSLHFNVHDALLTGEARQYAQDIHQSLCAACHDMPVQEVERPAYNLYSEAQTLAQQEFIARLLNGVRGDAFTGIDNPLSDLQIELLYRLYLSPPQ